MRRANSLEVAQLYLSSLSVGPAKRGEGQERGQDSKKPIISTPKKL